MRRALATASRSGSSGDFRISQKLGVLHLVALGRKDALTHWHWGGPGLLGSRDTRVQARGAKGYYRHLHYI